MSFEKIIKDIKTLYCKLLAIDKLIKTASVTYAELSILATTSSLVAGSKYLITDFQTLHIIPNTTDRNDTNTIIPVEPLLLTAISTSEFDEIVQSSLYPQDEIYYTIDNTAWDDLEAVGSKGKIYRRIDTTRKIDICQDWRHCIRRTWAADLTAYTGDAEVYCLNNTSVSTGQFYGNSNAAISLVAINSTLYVDTVMFPNSDETSNSLRNITITSAHEGGYSREKYTDFSNSVFFGTQIQEVNFNFANGLTFLDIVTNVKVTIAYGGNIILQGIRNIFCEGFFNNFIDMKFTSYGRNDTVSALMGNTALLYDSTLFATKPAILLDSTFTRLVHTHIKIAGGTSFIISKEYGGWRTILKLSQNTTINLDRQVISSINLSAEPITPYYDKNYSNIERTVAAAATIAASGTTNLYGVYNLTGAGTVVVNTLTQNTTILNATRVPLILRPESGLTIQLTNNDVDYGILTNSQTYEANGASGETIMLNWVKDRFQVVSGRTL